MVVREGVKEEEKATPLGAPHCASLWAFRPNAAAAVAAAEKMAAYASPAAAGEGRRQRWQQQHPA